MWDESEQSQTTQTPKAYFLEEITFQVTVREIFIVYHSTGQIIATSHDLTPNGGLGREISYFWEIWVKVKYCIIIWPELYITVMIYPN